MNLMRVPNLITFISHCGRDATANQDSPCEQKQREMWSQQDTTKNQRCGRREAITGGQAVPRLEEEKPKRPQQTAREASTYSHTSMGTLYGCVLTLVLWLALRVGNKNPAGQHSRRTVSEPSRRPRAVGNI